MIVSQVSLSARRAWIEIVFPPPQVKPVRVALRKESVDRNKLFKRCFVGQCVALRKESVDRNKNNILCSLYIFFKVALRKESVDRNQKESTAREQTPVALRKESVDRNC